MNAPAQDIRDGGSVWVELSWQRDVLREKIDLSNLAALPVGLELGRFDGYDIPCSGGMVTCKVPPELGKGGRCAALRVSDVFVDSGSRRILGGMGSNVYPTVDAGIYAMTNQIVAAVMKVSSGKATVTRLQMNRQGGYGEMKFWWKGEDAAKEMELVVRGYVNAATGGPPVLPARRQMAVCTFLHTKGDGIKARFGHKGAWAGLRLVATADQISHRRARRIHGRYVMKVDDCFTGTAVEMGYNVGKAAGSGT